MDRSPDNRFAWRCAVTIFLGAFLLFQVQPLISKMILPWFGGSPAVWTTCMLFFQFVLLLGYLYADVLTRVRRPGWQVAIHLGLLVAAVCLLPITRAESFKPVDSSQPTIKILLLLSVAVGLPYLAVSTTGPLVQTWFSKVYGGRSPYRLYALSNIGSLVALLSYPVLVEPLMSVRWQGFVWSIAFAVFAVLNGWLLVTVWRSPAAAPVRSDQASKGDANAPRAKRTRAEKRRDKKQVAEKQVDEEPSIARRPIARVAVWILLPAFASMMLLAVTNQLCQNVAVIPFLWILPLSLYLISFIICFDNPRWYDRRWFSIGAAVSILMVCNMLLSQHLDRRESGMLFDSIADNVVAHIAFYLAALFFLCMVCHGEVVRSKPAAGQLTVFYLCIAAGGAMGGLVVTLVCPNVFSSYFEMNLGLIAGYILAVVVGAVGGWQSWFAGRRIYQIVGGAVAVVGLGAVVGAQLLSLDPYWFKMERNFYGVLTIEENHTATDDPDHGYMLYSGASMHDSETIHGYQLLAPGRRAEPTMYFLPDSGVGIALNNFPRQQNRRVGIIGLGAGTIAAYGRAGDEFRFYEINPTVKQFADKHFTFLKDSAADTPVELGDGRLVLEREPPQQFDVFIIDAFSGDTIPAHLLTREAFEMYLTKHLKEDGVLAVHISNRYLNLTPVIARLAQHFGLPCVRIRNQVREEKLYRASADWLLMSRNEVFMKSAPVRQASVDVLDQGTGAALWTDQYNNLFQLLWRGRSENESPFGQLRDRLNW